MKKLISVVILFFVFCFSGQAGRIIFDFEIARWYLDADLVLICNVKQTDKFILSSHDSLISDGWHYKYDIIREKYQISLDSIVKGGEYINGTMDTIFTPNFSTSSWREKREFTGLNSKGDSVFIVHFEMSINCGDDDNNYFKIKSQEKHLVILRKTEIGYVIDYDTKCDSWILDLIKEVNVKGENYFSILPLLNQSVKSKDLQIYPNPFSDILHINGIQAKRIEITDINGNIIKTELQNLNRIDLSSLKPGIYFVSIFSDNNKWTEKLVKR